MPNQSPAQVELHNRQASGGIVVALRPGSWRLAIPAGTDDAYRWAQLDDYMQRSRREFCWQPPLSFSLSARASSDHILGTWGFGLWNDPFTASLGLGGMARRLPALPNTAWFFYASPPNYLSFRDDLPASGFLAASFRSPRIPAALILPGGLAAPFLLWPPTARLLRRLVRPLIQQSSQALEVDVTTWHDYRLDWLRESVAFWVDGILVTQTKASPRGPLGLVLWVDNQFAAFEMGGHLRFGRLANAEESWLELDGLHIER